MAIDRENRAEEEANRRRADQIEDARDGTEDDGIIGTVDRVFESVVDPVVAPDADDEDAERQRRLNDEATRRS